MNQDTILSKIVANATDNTWSQAYSTLNVYIALSIETESSDSQVATIGKEILEKIQREFFALDQKNLENIKKAVRNAVKTLEESSSHSILLGTIVGDILYIVISSKGKVLLLRDGELATVAKGTDNELNSFSGRLKHNDIILFETDGFSKKISDDTLSNYLVDSDVSSLSENITPLVHKESGGTEAAVILQYKNPQHAEVSVEKESLVDNEDTTIEDAIESNTKSGEDENTKKSATSKFFKLISRAKSFISPIKNSSTITSKKRFIMSGRIPAININRKFLIITAVILLILLLLGSLIFEKNRRTNEARRVEFQAIFDVVEKDFDEAVSLTTLNKTLALEELKNTRATIKNNLDSFPKDSDEYDKLTALLSSVNEKIEEIGGGKNISNQKKILVASESNNLVSIDAVIFKNGELVVIDSKNLTVVSLDTNGDIVKTYELKIKNPQYLDANESFIYVLGIGAERIDKGDGTSEIIVEDITGIDLGIFGSNIYILSKNDIGKYVPPSYQKSSYFSEETSFESTPSSLSIDGSIFVLENSGIIRKFTRGSADAFKIEGLLTSFGSGGKLYTDADYDNLYILDKQNARIVSISKNGEFLAQYEWANLKDAKSFTVDEESKVIYVIINDTLYSFDL